MTSVKDYYQYMSEADDNWFIQNSRFIAERDKNTQIHNAEKRGREEGVKEGAQQKAVVKYPPNGRHI